jgi:hypothetical protein
VRLFGLFPALALLSIGRAQDSPSPDAVAALFPAETCFYSAVGDLRKAIGPFKEYLRAQSKEGEGDALFEMIEKLIAEQVDKLPAGLKRDVRDGFNKLVSAHVGIVLEGIAEEPPLVIILRSDDPGFFPRFVADNLKMFADQTHELSGRQVFQIPTGAPFPLFVAGDRNLGIAATRIELLRGVFERIDGKDKRPSLKDRPDFKAWPPDLAVGASVYGSLEAIFSALPRSERFDFDRSDAALGFSEIRGGTGIVRLDQGQMAGEFELEIGKECALYRDIVRQKSGPRELLRLIPQDTLMFLHLNIEGGEPFRKQLENFLGQVDKEFGHDTNTYKEFAEDLGRELKIPIDDLAKVLGPEAAAYIPGGDFMALAQGGKGMGFLVRVADAKAAAAALEKVKAALPAELKFEPQEFRGVKIFASKEGFEPAYAFSGDALIFGSGIRTIERAVAAQLDRSSVADREDLLSKLPADTSKIMGYGLKPMFAMLRQVAGMMGGAGPLAAFPIEEFEKKISDKAIDIVTISETDRGWSLRSRGWGGAAPNPLGLAFMSFGMQGRVREAPRAVPVEPPPATERVEVPKDPKELEALIQSLVADLAADEAQRRESASRKLLGLGQVTVPALVKAYKTDDPDVRSRIEYLLVSLKAYDALPEVIDRALGDIVRRLQEEDQEERWDMWNPSQEGTHAIEPGRWMGRLDDQLRAKGADLSILDSAAGARGVARKVADAALSVPVRRQLARLLACLDTSACGPEIVQALETSGADETTKAWLLMSAGLAKDPAAQKMLRAALGSGKLAERRGAFLGAERSTDPAIRDALFDLVLSKDQETAFNATFTLRRISHGAVNLNSHWKPAKLADRLKAARGR